MSCFVGNTFSMAFLMLFWISFAKAHDVSTEQLLYTHLMKDYVKAVRPSSHFSLVTDINFVFALEQLIDVVREKRHDTKGVFF